jgi:hypothetical protein
MHNALCKLAITAALGLLAAQQAGMPPQDAAQQSNVATNLASRLLRIEDPDQHVRDSARRELLGLTTSELAELREALAELGRDRRLSPGIVRLAYDVTLHAHVRDAKLRFLAALPPEQRSGEAFLGIMLGGDLTSNTPGSPSGVAVRTANPGFVAYEAFEDGDVLVAVRTVRGLERLESFGDLRNAFYALSPGDSVEFLVLRGGALIRVPLRLDERPEPQVSNQQRWEMAAIEARRAAQAFWDEQIVPLLPPPATPVARSD